jgi:hypothetical protein
MKIPLAPRGYTFRTITQAVSNKDCYNAKEAEYSAAALGIRIHHAAFQRRSPIYTKRHTEKKEALMAKHDLAYHLPSLASIVSG